MKPEEKAKDLINKLDLDGNYLQGLNARKMQAVICVDEIMKSNELEIYDELKPHISSLEFTSDDGWVNDEKLKYWQEVKSIIQEL